MGQTTHISLLARLADGTDPVAWREFCDRYGGLIRGFARRQRLQDADCEDVVQEVMTALTKSMPSFQYDPEKGTFRSYLKTATIHAIHRRLRQKQGAIALEEIEQAAVRDAADPEIDERWELEWRQYHLQRAMEVVESEFNEADRAAFDAYALGNRGAQETGDSLGMTIAQVYQAKSRILRRLSQLVTVQVQEEG